MWILPGSGMMSTRVMCCLKIRLHSNISRTVLKKLDKYNVSKTCKILWNSHNRIHSPSQLYSEESIEETGESEEFSLPFSRSIMMEDYSDQFRNTLYPNSDDTLMSKLKSCDSIKDLFKTINENVQSLTSSHYCQTLLVVYDILHTNNNFRPTYGTSYGKLPNNIASEQLSYIILKILCSLKDDVEKLTPEELACCLLYSKRLGVDIKHPTVQTILMRIDNLLSNRDPDSFSISALSRFTITFDNGTELWTKLFLIKTLPLIYLHFDNCQSTEEFRALTISMLSTVSYLREDLLMAYEALTEEFIRKGLITKDDHSVIVKAVMLLNHIYHNPAARYMIYTLLHMLHGRLDNMFLPHLIEVQKVVSQQIEPRNCIVELSNLKRNVLLVPPIDDSFLSHYLPLVQLPVDSKGTNFMKDLIARCDDVESLLNAQPHLTTAMPDVCKLFWSRMADLLQHSAPGNLQVLTRVCFRYMMFSHRMVSYRHRQFESAALTLVARELVAGMSVMYPKVLALLASFVLMVDSSHGAASLSSDVTARLVAVMGQLDAQSCLWVSQGLGDHLRRSKDIHIVLQLDSAISERTKELLATEDLSSIKTFNIILRSCINRKQSMESDLMRDVISRSQSLDWNKLTTRGLRNMVYNLHITGTLLPPAVDRMVQYCLANRAHVVVNTVGKLVHLCYHLGYAPLHIDSFCSLAADLAIRDGDMLNGLSLLQIALALSFFNRLPHSLVRVIFTVDFLESLDKEIKHCFAKDRYPQKVRQTLMELNRSVCLDQPEADVPWFHSKFCEEQKALGQLEVVPKSLLFTDVYSVLLKLMGDAKYIGTRSYTPYGYLLDLQLNLDSSLNPVPFKNTENVAQKLALLLYHSDSYTACEERMKGYHQMKQRHLEILGYRVIGLSDSVWNSMFMAEPKVKLQYLRNLIWCSS